MAINIGNHHGRQMASNSDPLGLDITVISAEDLRIKGKPIKNNAYVTVKNDSGSRNASLSTGVDTTGKNYPSWNEKLHVDLPFHSPFLILEVRRRYGPSSSAGDCLVGSARIPVPDFVGNYMPENYLHFLSYRLRDASGVRNGIINISVRVSRFSPSSSSSLCGPSSLPSSSQPEFEIPSWLPTSSQPAFGIPVDGKKKGATVTGVPFWYPNSRRTNISE